MKNKGRVGMGELACISDSSGHTYRFAVFRRGHSGLFDFLLLPLENKTRNRQKRLCGYGFVAAGFGCHRAKQPQLMKTVPPYKEFGYAGR